MLYSLPQCTLLDADEPENATQLRCTCRACTSRPTGICARSSGRVGGCGLVTARSTTRGTTRSTRDEDAPLAVHVVYCERQLILLDLELELADAGADDEGVGVRAELANLALAYVECICDSSVRLLLSRMSPMKEAQGSGGATYFRP